MKKKMIPLIISAIIFISGFVTTIIGIVKNSGVTYSNLPTLDLFSISDEDVGKMFSSNVYSDIMYIEDTENGALYLMWMYSSLEDDCDLMVIGFDVPKSVAYIYENAEYSDEYSEKPFPICGTVRKSNDTITEKMSTAILDYYEFLKELYAGTEGIINEEAINESLANISPYYIEVAETANGAVLIWTGSAVMAVAVIVLLATLFGRRFLLIFAGTFAALIIALLAAFAGKLRTMSTITEVSDGLYKMTCHYDYKCDKFLNADIGSIDEFIEWATKEHFFGLPIDLDTRDFGCCAFTAETPEGQRLFGRNFDYDETDTLVIYTEPKDGYASYGVVDLKFFGIGENESLEGDSLPARALMLAAPYVTMDGANEAGVGVGILQLDIDELHQDNGKTDLLIFAAIRGILDKCATVDEAIALLDNYDIHSFLSRSYHLFITDKTGRSVIVEWTDSETFIVEDTACTNDVMSNNEFYDPDWYCDRYDIIKKRLSEKNSILTEAEAMSVTSDASWEKKDMSRGTEWSCVYNLDDFSFEICLDRDYETKHAFTKEDFR